jgi:hypothetical protein
VLFFSGFAVRRVTDSRSSIAQQTIVELIQEFVGMPSCIGQPGIVVEEGAGFELDFS